MIWFDSFFDEMEKISGYLSDEDRRRKALLMAGLGATSIPAMSAASNKVMTGKWTPKGVPLKRWAPAAIGQGLFWGTALPAAQHYLTRKVEQGAQERRQAKNELKSLVVPAGGVKSALKMAPEIAPKVDPVIGA